MKYHHVGIAVESIVAHCDKHGYVIPEIIDDDLNAVRIGFVGNVELVEPLEWNTAIPRLIKKYKERPYHICYEVGDLDGAIERYRDAGWIQVSEPKPAVAFLGRKIVFMYRTGKDFVELLEA